MSCKAGLIETLARGYDRLIDGLALLAAIILVMIVVAIAMHVGLHALDLPAPHWIGSATEYGLLYMTLLAAPWLVRQRAHIVIPSLRQRLPAILRRPTEYGLYVLAVVVCLGLAYYGLVLTLQALERGDLDIRSFDMPRWLIYAPMALGFLLIAIEFGRFLVRGTSYFETDGGPQQGL